MGMESRSSQWLLSPDSECYNCHQQERCPSGLCCRSRNFLSHVTKGHFTCKLELLCQLPKNWFTRRIPFGNNPFHLVY